MSGIFADLFEDSIQTIKSWEPTQEYSNENLYRNDLIEFLRKKLNERQNPFSFGQQRRVSITKEDGRGLCDIGINKTIGIELKKDLKSKSQVDRLAGQIIGYKKDYQDLIIVLVGHTNKDALEILKDNISELSGRNAGFGFNQGNRIRIIDKCPQIKDREKPKQKSRSLFDIELPNTSFGFKF